MVESAAAKGVVVAVVVVVVVVIVVAVAVAVAAMVGAVAAAAAAAAAVVPAVKSSQGSCTGPAVFIRLALTVDSRRAHSPSKSTCSDAGYRKSQAVRHTNW